MSIKMKGANIQLKPQLVRAGAGTGKTSRLVKEVYSLFKNFKGAKGRPPRLIVCAFTRKSAQELKEKLFKKAARELKGDAPKDSPLFLSYIQSPSLYISTIDGILNRFLKRHGRAFGLSPDFKLSHSRASEDMFDSIAEEFVFKKHFSLLKKIPYPFLKDIFISFFKNRLKYGPLSFYSEKDFEEFKEEKNLFNSAKDLFKKPRGMNRDWKAIKKYFSGAGSPLAEFLDSDNDLEIVKKLFSPSEEKSFEPSCFTPLFREFEPAGEEFFHDFMERKKSSGALDMDDLLLLSFALLKERPESARRFCAEWDYWLIDEYQDTSWIQEQIIHQINGFKNVFCVGDPGQSIYFFRGADPYVFKRREEALAGETQKLSLNYRSRPELVYFYNDFFKEEDGFLKFHPPKPPGSLDKPSVYFLTYEKEKGEESRQEPLQALFHYIQKLRAEGCEDSDIAILSSKNAHLLEIAGFLREKNIPVMLSSSKNFARKRLILDALFLLKFLINPYDNDNLKALLRTPYFRLPDQELAQACFDHHKLCESQARQSFWAFARDRFSDRLFIQSLSFYLELKPSRGLALSFEKAVMESGLADLSYFQDPTGSFESSLWKFIRLLNKRGSSALELFYSLMDEGDQEEEGSAEPPSCSREKALELMTIHKSKGLEFDNVIVMDFSIGSSSSLRGNRAKDLIIYDESRRKMAFAAPSKGRESAKIKSYGHKICSKKRDREKLLERNRLFYVAMTRAKRSLAFFIPNAAPEKNSWLEGAAFFKNFKDGALLSERYGDQGAQKGKRLFWRLVPGHYKTDSYSLCAQASEAINQFPEKFIAGEILKGSGLLLDKKISQKGQPQSRDQTRARLKSHKLSPGRLAKGGREEPVLTGGEDYFGEPAVTLFKSSQDFAQDLERGFGSLDLALKGKGSFRAGGAGGANSVLHQNIQTAKSPALSLEPNTKPPFSLLKEKNFLFKANLGSHLHFYLQKLAYQPFEKLKPLIESAFLPPADKDKIAKALNYIAGLKDPDMSCFFKTGYAEWPFQLKKREVILRGQIDLWAWDAKEICLFEYKSSSSQSPKAKKQLIFYSGVLAEMCQPEKIWMFELYPFEKKFYKSCYDSRCESLFKSWLNSLTKASGEL